MIEETKFTFRHSSGKVLRVPMTLVYRNGRIEFPGAPFEVKDQIKCMRGSRWHGFGDGPKMWSVQDCPRNRLQIGFLKGEKVYSWFDRPVRRHEYTRPLMLQQTDMADRGLTYHYQIFAAEMGTGKSLAAQEVVEKSGVDWWIWCGPKSSLPNMRREFTKWGFPFDRIKVDFMTYEKLRTWVDRLKPGDPIPAGLILDESTKCKTESSARTIAAQKLADLIRERYGLEGYVILMSGTPSPKTPLDWWAQAEICWPGYLKEGATAALEQRLAFIAKKQLDTGVVPTRIGWRDDEKKCEVCGRYAGDACHDPETFDSHDYRPSRNEVAYLYERLKGLVVIWHKKDCLQLPEKRYRVIECKPSASLLRAAKLIADSAESAVLAHTQLRELSDGFQYRDKVDGKTRCSHCPNACGQVDEWFLPKDSDRGYSSIDLFDPEVAQRFEKRLVTCPRCSGTGEMPRKVRETKVVPCPKDKALEELLDENDEHGRIVIFAGFTGSVDRIVALCQKKGWNIFRCDGRGSEAITYDGTKIKDMEPLEFWATNPGKVAFVAHPESGGMSLTLTEARCAVFYSNSFKPEYRSQAEDRIHRKGMDENVGCEIVDLIHLPTDEKVLKTIRENRKLELMTMGEINLALSA